MFSSKNKKTKNEVDVSIKTMERDLKGDSAKNMNVEYKGEASPENSFNKNTDTQQLESKSKKEDFIKPLSTDIPNTKQEVKPELASSLYNQGDAPNIPQGTFSKKEENISLDAGINKSETPSSSVDNGFSFKNDAPNIDNKAKDVPFLHKTTDKIEKNKLPESISNAGIKSPTKTSKTGSIIWIIVFILFLAGILLGGYFFYMKKDTEKAVSETKTKQDTNNEVNTTENTTATTENDSQKQNTNNSQEQTSTTQKQNVATTDNRQIANPQFNTTEATFFTDLQGFISQINKSENKAMLDSGVLVTPMLNEGTPFFAENLLKAVKMSDILKVSDLKPACKVFVSKKGEEVQTALVFELADNVDAKIVKDMVISKEKELPATMQRLFINRDKPVIPADIKFSVNTDNKNARYFNYQPGKTSASVDWNILDLGMGKILYFATSHNLAEKITGYLMNLVMK